MAAAQAIDFRRRALGDEVRMGQGTAAAYDVIRAHIPFLSEDVELAPYMTDAARLVASGAIRAAVQEAIGTRY
jgi:histidine ammonia-lyase